MGTSHKFRASAKQIHTVIDDFLMVGDDFDIHGSGVNLKCMLVTGGRSVAVDMDEFRMVSPHIVVATPGKLEELIKQPAFNVKDLDVLVLDEADRLLDMGFEQSLRNIMSSLPKQRRTGLFSATMTDGLSDLVKAGLRNPVRVVVKVEDATTNEVQRIPATLSISYMKCPANEKFEHLVRLLLARMDQKVIVYFSTCHAVDFYHKILTRLPFFKQWTIAGLHGKLESKKRPGVLEKFISAPSGVLLCTDIAARGLDFQDVDYVVQVDPPQDPQAFLHRCGRTARQGRSGDALVILQPHEDTYIEFLKLRKIPCQEVQIETATSNAAIPVLPGVHVPLYYAPSKEQPSNEAATKRQIARPDIRTFIHSLVLGDRAIYDAQVRAFVSYLKSYKEHQLKYIFPFKKLPLDRVMEGFYLLLAPKCPELKEWTQRQSYSKKSADGEFKFVQSIRIVDVEKIAYADKAREKQRQLTLQQRPDRQHNHKRKKREEDAWSKKKQLKERRLERREKKERKRIAIEKAQEVQLDKQLAEEKACMSDDGDWEDMQKETRLLKKLKTGKISKQQFEAELGETDVEVDEE